MSLEVDLILDRRRLKRRLFFWRAVAVLALIFAIAIAAEGAGYGVLGPRIARVSVSGIITEDRELSAAIDGLADDQQVKAVFLSIDSPGGSVAGGETLHDVIARVAARKPVVALMGGVAASAGYMIALPASRIYAREATLTGSIGVLLQTGEVSGLLEKVGVTAQTIRSGPLKDEPSLTRPLSAPGRLVLQGIVDDMYDQFVSMVATGRNLPVEQVRELADGRAYTGRQALALGLIDSIGGERDARKWLQTAKGISTDLPVRDVSGAGYGAKALSGQLGSIVQDAWKVLISQSVSLDGPLAIWHRPID